MSWQENPRPPTSMSPSGAVHTRIQRFVLLAPTLQREFFFFFFFQLVFVILLFIFLTGTWIPAGRISSSVSAACLAGKALDTS